MNNNLSIVELEKQMYNHLEQVNSTDFLFSFNLYHCANPNTENTLFLKSAALLFYISDKNLQEYNKLIQTIKINEIENEFVCLVLNINDSICRLDFDSLKSFAENCNEKLRKLIIKIYENQIASIENTLKQPIGSNSVPHPSLDSIATIQDCTFVVENYLGN